ncbi:DnaJ/Hsp40 cysteine-rich domain superfamily protein [Perilla frutescens var. hirtella]|nr:DnaJ/Hsp40 cysteine-rich domain superfamily protein [Perilla frutescens var. hirtella]KAH6806627.1 DnaJ/Hsp40 cysteine-rich domain superfamily protein [Perilla frutescens var. frutescens]
MEGHLMSVEIKKIQNQDSSEKMALSLCSSPRMSLNTSGKPGLISDRYTSRRANWITDATYSSKNEAFESLKVNATENKSSAKVNSILCTDCEGNGAKKCGQCLGTGINSVDHFNGQFKAGASCWLCRGKKEVLCGSCNGAGFLGGFMSTYDD